MILIRSHAASAGWLVALAAAVMVASSAAAASRVLSHVDGIGHDGTQAFASGWACEQAQAGSVSVRLYADALPDGTPTGAIVASGMADLDNEPPVADACQDKVGKHRFKIALPGAVTQGREPKFVAQASAAPAPVPKMSGGYASLPAHPRVFTTQSELQSLARRIAVANSYSARRFALLAEQITRDLAAPADWTATYSGCDAEIYQYAFSYEPQDGHAAEVHAALRLAPAAVAPAGAAVVASRLALYAALIKAGAPAPGGAPGADQAAELARRIELAWAQHGFRDGHGKFLATPSQFCDSSGKPAASSEGLTIGRGIIYSAHAQDLLMYVGVLDGGAAAELDRFHAAMFELMRNSHNYSFLQHPAWGCDQYSNHAANRAAALLTLARLLDDRRKFEAALYGADPSIPVALPWIALFNGAIYGEADTPHSCYFNTGPDGATSSPFFQTAAVAPGEIDDRYRNHGPGQGIGYPMFTLERLVDAAEVLRFAGFDPYAYHGRREQSIETAMEYYACFGKAADFGKIVTAENSRSCHDAAQYVGKIVNGVDRMLTIGAYRYPRNPAIGAVAAAAKLSSSSGPFSLDAILFGKWSD